MTTITEDYVSFETAKLLKEKGFEGYSILTIYDKDAANAYIKELQEKHLPYSSDDPKLKEFYYTKPTLQMAMKWLRDVHHIFINVQIGWTDPSQYEHGWFVEKMTSPLDHVMHEVKRATTYEKCVDDAIKYCLEHLI